MSHQRAPVGDICGLDLEIMKALDMKRCLECLHHKRPFSGQWAEDQNPRFAGRAHSVYVATLSGLSPITNSGQRRRTSAEVRALARTTRRLSVFTNTPLLSEYMAIPDSTRMNSPIGSSFQRV